MSNTQQCPVVDPGPDKEWVCALPEGHAGGHAPTLSAESEQFLEGSETLRDALFNVALLFNVPVTNNYRSWIETPTQKQVAEAQQQGHDPALCGDVVWDVCDFVLAVEEIIERFKNK